MTPTCGRMNADRLLRRMPLGPSRAGTLSDDVAIVPVGLTGAAGLGD
jgi:hypothetical protein